MTLRQLARIRWGVRAALVLGVATSVAANVLHANPNPISQAIAAWPPLALLLTVELISRVPVHRRSLAAVRLAATASIASIAAWVSYWHMAGVAARYGETGAAPYLIPVSVDGLVVVASVCLVELAGRIRTLTEAASAEVSATVHQPTTAAVDPAPVEPAPAADDTPEKTPPAVERAKPTTRAVRPRSSRRPPSADKVAKAAARMPGATVAAIAAKAGVSESTARRYLPASVRTSDDAVVASALPASPAATPVLADAA
ncbi:DUF2637 domain-containing protein [Virgisporangium aurantiacum]|uniref:DUF2637 domain-containing protein n=1 Tax=Virgisporangium aurantiacum TaxID=175570 RepID=A0A8J3YYX6_9ACTN|nr:DUF2637 domain-containing protein [Virgisporangium aurantiacum]GIJ53223.1 hypothetical protein Vau01_007390 [Virgisporangium aurantiacum]